jgi:hypothetical protein
LSRFDLLTAPARSAAPRAVVFVPTVTHREVYYSSVLIKAWRG